MEKINENLYRTTTSYKDIFTTMYIIKTDEGDLLFDAASFDDDTQNYTVPFLEWAGVTPETLKYIFISHEHADHAGGLATLTERYPNATIVSRSPNMPKTFAHRTVLCPSDNDTLLSVLQVVTIIGHTADSSAILDTRSGTLVTGDCLQLYGIFGSGKWGANINFPAEHLKAIEKVRKLKPQKIYTAHDYHPCGFKAEGVQEVKYMLSMCEKPLLCVKKLIMENPDLNDEEIVALYNSPSLPTMGAHVVAAIRNAIKKGLI